jgi:uncharacterized RDD family membrane protein YckC
VTLVARDDRSLAPVGDRLAATSVDALIVLVPCLWVEAFLPWFGVVLTLTTFFTYEVASLVLWNGQTVGKQLRGIRVARADNGRRPSLSEAAARTARKAVCFVPFLGWTYGVLSALLTVWREHRDAGRGRMPRLVVVKVGG